MTERVKMTCPSCGYTCVPQWLNDEATCLKCFTVLRRRPAGAGAGAGAAVHDPLAGRVSGEVSTFKASPGDARESAGGSCPKSPDGMHHYKFGKCSHCNKPEPVGQHPLASRPTPARSGAGASSKAPVDPSSFNVALHNGAKEDLVETPAESAGSGVLVPGSGARRVSGEASTFKLAPSDARESAGGSCPKSADGMHHYKFGKCTHCNKPEPAGWNPRAGPKSGEEPQPGVIAPKQMAARNDRTKVECPSCGYKCVPQWLNDRAHCLKCQAVLKVQDSCHTAGGQRRPMAC